MNRIPAFRTLAALFCLAAALLAGCASIPAAAPLTQTPLIAASAETDPVDTAHDAADVLLLKPGVQGFITAVRAARSARFGARFSVLAGVVGLLAAVPAALGYLEPAGAAMVSLGLLVVTGLVIRVRSRWLD